MLCACVFWQCASGWNFIDSFFSPQHPKHPSRQQTPWTPRCALLLLDRWQGGERRAQYRSVPLAHFVSPFDYRFLGFSFIPSSLSGQSSGTGLRKGCSFDPEVILAQIARRRLRGCLALTRQVYHGRSITYSHCCICVLWRDVAGRSPLP